MPIYETTEDRTLGVKQPIVQHANPDDYGLTREAVVMMRIAYLQKLLALAEDEFTYYKSKVIAGNIFFNYGELNKISAKVRKIQKNIHFQKKSLNDDNEIETFDLVRLKAIPMDTLTEILPSGFFVRNPFRNEGSPSNSLHWYKAKNIWTDFATAESGDNIDLMMKIHNCGFRDACKMLNIS